MMTQCLWQLSLLRLESGPLLEGGVGDLGLDLLDVVALPELVLDHFLELGHANPLLFRELPAADEAVVSPS